MFFKRCFTKKRIREKKSFLSPKDEFANAMDYISQILRFEENTEDKIIVLDFILNIIKKDLQYDVLTTILYSDEYFKREIGFLFPLSYYDENGDEFTVYRDTGKHKDIDLSKDCVLVIPWNRNRLRSSIKNIYENDFEYHSNNHFAYYFTYIDLCHVYNGTHSVSAGIGHKKGIIKAKECDITYSFNHIHTNGEQWFNTHTKEPIKKVFDFRIAILYEIAKIKYSLESKIQESV